MMFIWILIIGVLLYFLLGENMNVKVFQKQGAHDLLNERLAKGEINITEYQEIKRTLKENEK